MTMNAKELNLPVPMLHEMFTATESGRLFWKRRPVSHFTGSSKRTAAHACANWNSRYSGSEAFTCESPFGHRFGRINNQVFYAHRVIWAMNTGAWPEHEIDHINGIASDNRLANLRDVTHRENLRNQRTRKNSTTGINGVTLFKRDGLYAASISVDGKARHIGYFKTADEAKAARVCADKQHGFHPNHGKV